jgi:hypothetical protein
MVYYLWFARADILIFFVGVDFLCTEASAKDSMKFNSSNSTSNKSTKNTLPKSGVLTYEITHT